MVRQRGFSADSPAAAPSSSKRGAGPPRSPSAPRADEALACSFLTSADDLTRCPPSDEPEVAFAGRSNAGKSSTLNRLAGRKQLARVSKTPGRTQLINFFQVATGGRLVDLPGYGYARASKTRRDAWGHAIDDYLNNRPNLTGLVLVMDARHPLQPFDETMIAWCAERHQPLLALLNKADKLKRGARTQTLRSVQSQMPEGTSVLAFSATEGLGAAEALAFLRARLNFASE